MKITVDIKSISEGRLNISYDNGALQKDCLFEVPLDYYISSDSLVALTIAARPVKVSEVSYNFPVTMSIKDILQRDYNITISGQTEVISENILFGLKSDYILTKKEKTFLNFSGGVDSLAGHYLCGSDVPLLSINYGGYFERESEFFKKWNTIVVTTDFRKKPFIENLDWRFMASGAILYSDYLGIDSLLWGTILEASPYWFSVKEKNPYEKQGMYHVFGLSKIRIGQTVSSLSEFGTTKIASLFGDDILNKSILSAASPGSSKLFRKKLLERVALDLPITDKWLKLNKPKEQIIFGKSFADDILCLYFAWKLGANIVEKYIMEKNYDFADAVRYLNMEFFEKYNPYNLPSVPPHLRNRFVEIYKSCGIEPYMQSDRDDLNNVREVLSNYHNL